VHADARDEEEAGEQRRGDARDRRDRIEVPGRAPDVLEARGLESHGVGTHHAQEHERQREEHARGDEDGSAQTERFDERQHGALQPRDCQEPGARTGQQNAKPRAARSAIGPTAAECITRRECRQRHRDECRPKEEADAVERSEKPCPEHFDRENCGARNRDHDVENPARSQEGHAHAPRLSTTSPWVGSRRSLRSWWDSLRVAMGSSP
jgi:hypothetical protein